MALETEDNINSHVGLLELEELEVIEIDEALLRELLEEQGEKVEADNVAWLEESAQKDNKTVDKRQQDENQEQKITCSSDHQQQEGCCSIEFEWMNNNSNNMMEMEPTSQNEQMIMNWYPEDDDDMVGMMVDFGCVTHNAEFGSQVCEGNICYEASYGCLWDDL